MDTPPNGPPLGEFTAALETLVTQAMADFDVPGLALGIVKDNRLWYARGFGVRSFETREPVTPDSLFHVASVSKPFVATAVLQLVEAGKLDLDIPVTTYLPYFHIAGAGAKAITLRQMLSHTAGMPDSDDYGWHRPEHDDRALERYVRSLASASLIAAPGDGFEYSNAAFEVVGDVISKVSGLSFEACLKSSVLDRLGMRNSSFVPGEVPAHLATMPHLGLPPAVVPGAYPYHRAHAPSSTLHSSVVELSLFAKVHLDRGSLNGGSLLDPRTHDMLWQAQVHIAEDGLEQAAGLGWFMGSYRGHRTVSHDGGDPGFESNLVLLPDVGIALVLLANCNTAPLGPLTDATLDLLLGCSPQAPRPPVVVPVAKRLAREGHDAAIALYRSLTQRPDDIDVRPSRFADAVWGAIEVHRPELVRPLLELWIELQPDDSRAHEMRGWADAVSGDRHRAAASLRRALELDPDNEHAAQLLAAVSGPQEAL